MCGTLSNMRQDVKNNFRLLNGDTIKFREIDEALNEVSREMRGQLSRKVLSSLPKNTHFVFCNWIGTTTKKSPVPPEHKELITFLTLGDFAVKNGLPVQQVVDGLAAQRLQPVEVLGLRA